jgi:hypothetical protein
MRVVEEPFVTREGILRVLRPTQLTTERPFATMRRKQAASDGLAIRVQARGGQLIGRVRVYSSLNTDAARAFRRRDVELAQQLALRAGGLERSDAAGRLRQAVVDAAAQLSLDARSRDAPPALQRYVEMRRRTTLGDTGRWAFVAEWLAQSGVWLSTGHDALVEAVIEMDRGAAEARADLIDPAEMTASTFFGTVARMDTLRAEIDGSNDQSLLLSRDQLEREGLAVIGQAVAVLEEVLPGGRYSRVMPAVALDAVAVGRPSPYDEDLPDLEGGVVGVQLAPRDRDWFRRALDRPTAVPVAPLRLV